MVLVTATDGARGLAGAGDGHGATLAQTPARRAAGLGRGARLCPGGLARVRRLRAAAPTRPTPRPSPTRTSRRPPSGWPRCCGEERADVLTIYDRNGGYGHPDHVQVHRVGTRAAELAGTPVVLEATVARRRVPAVLRAAPGARATRSARSAPLGIDRVFSDRAGITHRVRVRRSCAPSARRWPRTRRSGGRRRAAGARPSASGCRCRCSRWPSAGSGTSSSTRGARPPSRRRVRDPAPALRSVGVAATLGPDRDRLVDRDDLRPARSPGSGAAGRCTCCRPWIQCAPGIEPAEASRPSGLGMFVDQDALDWQAWS